MVKSIKVIQHIIWQPKIWRPKVNINWMISTIQFYYILFDGGKIHINFIKKEKNILIIWSIFENLEDTLLNSINKKKR